MRASAQRVARRLWSGELGWIGWPLAMALTPVAWVWGGVTRLRKRRYRRTLPASIEGLTVVSVGNLAVGGTGKTPVASWVTRRYLDDAARPALLLSGYGPDEKLLHRRWTPDAAVLTDRDRVAAARRARDEGHDVAVLDDGFQHRALARDLDVVVLSAEDRFPGPLLPRGPYREPASALARADVVIVTRRSASEAAARSLAERASAYAPEALLAGVQIEGGVWRDMDGGPLERALGDVLAVTAIGRPETFRATVRELVTGSVDLVDFADHHVYTDADVRRVRALAGDRPVVTTEKDAVKLDRHRAALGETYVLVQELGWDWGEAEVIAALPRPGGSEAA